jgi:hypothetical protein
MHNRESACGSYCSHHAVAVLGAICLIAAGCGGGSDVPTSPTEVRYTGSDTGTVHGTVLAPGRHHDQPTWYEFGPPVAGATVELGIWRGSALEFRDSAVAAVTLRMDDPRFRVVERSLTNAMGEYRFGGVPKTQVFAMRVRPPPGSPYNATYFESLFWLFRSSEMELAIVLRDLPN